MCFSRTICQLKAGQRARRPEVMQAKKSKSLLEKLRAKLPKPPSKEDTLSVNSILFRLNRPFVVLLVNYILDSFSSSCCRGQSGQVLGL